MALGISKSSYYYKGCGRDRRKRDLDPELTAKIMSLTGYELAYGYRKVAKKLRKYNHKKVHRHMKALGRTQPRRHKKKDWVHLPTVCPIRPNIRWEGDLSYVFDGTQNTYLFAVIDCYDKELIGDYHGLRCRADEALASLRRAVWNRFGADRVPNDEHVTLRIDQGSQYISKKFREGAANLGIKLEYCGINCPNEKPYIESFFAQYKREEVYRSEYRCFTDASDGWESYRAWYNSDRIHQGIGWRTIAEFRQCCESRCSSASENRLGPAISVDQGAMVPRFSNQYGPGNTQFVASF